MALCVDALAPRMAGPVSRPLTGQLDFRIRFEGALAAPTPKQQRLFTIVTLQRRGKIEQRAEQNGAVIVHKFDEPSLGDEAAELDQLAGAFAPLHDPGAGVDTGTAQFKPVALDGRTGECRPTRVQSRELAGGARAERRPRPAGASPPSSAHPHP